MKIRSLVSEKYLEYKNFRYTIFNSVGNEKLTALRTTIIPIV